MLYSRALSPKLQATASRAEHLLAALAAEGGYRVVFAGLLAAPYTGQNQPLNDLHSDHPDLLTWWERFFDWL
jgi:hypothetical protein